MPVVIEEYVGPVAGIATSISWTATSILFTAASRRLGATATNGLRLALAAVFLGITLRLLDGIWWPDITSGQCWYLGLSGLLGLTICDQFLFTAFVDIGPRRSLLILTLAPLFALGLGVAYLDELLGPLALLGVGLTLAGVLWVLLERRQGKEATVLGGHFKRGVVLVIIAAALQAAGALLAKRGMGHGDLPAVEHLDPLAATHVRMVFGLLGAIPLLAWSQLRRRAAKPKRAAGERRAGLIYVTLGAVFGPFLGVWASVIAYDRAPLGVAQTLCSLSPVFILPFVFRLYGERVGARGLLGSLLAIGGAALLFVV
jgi:drug/metabolite transporter (DMT)-like permease